MQELVCGGVSGPSCQVSTSLVGGRVGGWVAQARWGQLSPGCPPAHLPLAGPLGEIPIQGEAAGRHISPCHAVVREEVGSGHLTPGTSVPTWGWESSLGRLSWVTSALLLNPWTSLYLVPLWSLRILTHKPPSQPSPNLNDLCTSCFQPGVLLCCFSFSD